jgi:glycosyltransferase involved in cell wall biosynthesis
MKLVVVIPALDEAQTIAGVVGGVPRRIDGVDDVEVVVVDDGSTDETAVRAREAGADVISHRRRAGVGAAFRTGLAAALERGAGLIVNIDGDGQFDPGDIPTLVRPVLGGEADFVTCTRFGDPALVPTMPWIKRFGNAAVCWMVNRVTGEHFTDVSCGFRAYSREAALRLNLFGDFTYTQETFIDLAKRQVRIAEMPLPVRGTREFGTSRVAASIPRYAVRSFSILLRAARDLDPMAFFGTIGLVVFGLGVILGAWVLGHWLATGKTTPYTQFLTGSAVGLIVGFLLGVLALVADMLGRQRRLTEDLLYFRRREAAERAARQPNPAPDDRA